MRKIEYLMVEAIRKRTWWKLDNTEVRLQNNHLFVYLFGNLIAFEVKPTEEGPISSRFVINGDILERYATATTLSRLRAMGFNFTTRKGVVYHNDVPVAQRW